MIRAARIILTLVTGLFCIVPLSSVSAQTSGIGGRPANPDPANSRSASIFIYKLLPGASKQDQVLVSNNTAVRQAIELYAVDATTTNTGSLACRQQVEPKVEVGKWVALSQNSVILEAGQNQLVDFSVKVPDGASPGEHDGCLVFQQQSDEGEVHGNIRIRTRQAVRMAITVPGDIHKSVSLQSLELHGDKPVVFSATIKNTGNTSSDVDVRVTLSNLFGRELYKNGGSYPVFGGNKLMLTFRDDHKPAWGGFYVGQAMLRYDRRPGVFGFGDASQLIDSSSAKKVIFVMPDLGPLFVYIFVLSSLMALYYKWYKNKQGYRWLQSDWQEYAVQPDDTLDAIARRHGINWKDLARVNALRPPYQLRTGRKIKVPAAAPFRRTGRSSKPKKDQ
jgi:LysM repeat protein